MNKQKITKQARTFAASVLRGHANGASPAECDNMEPDEYRLFCAELNRIAERLYPTRAARPVSHEAGDR